MRRIIVAAAIIGIMVCTGLVTANAGELDEFFAAAGKGVTARTREFLSMNPKLVNARNNDGVTALMGAAAGGHNETVRLLIERGADVNAAIDHNQKPVGNTSIYRKGMTALMFAAMGNRLDTMKLLIARGADVNAKNCDGMTVLMYGVCMNHRDTAELLILHGADVNAKSQGGQTALKYATRGWQKEIMDLLKRHGARE
jgi:uncharacterized protein